MDSVIDDMATKGVSYEMSSGRKVCKKKTFCTEYGIWADIRNHRLSIFTQRLETFMFKQIHGV